MRLRKGQTILFKEGNEEVLGKVLNFERDEVYIKNSENKKEYWINKDLILIEYF